MVTLLFISSRAMAAEINITKFEEQAYNLTTSKKPAKYNGAVVSEEGDNPFYLRIGYSVMPLSGPTGAVGIVIGGHNIEVGATYGLSKTDNLFFYDKQQNLLAVNNYQAMNWQVRYGYMIKVGETFRVMPQTGVAFNISSTTEVNGYNATSAKYDKASATSALVAVPVMLQLNKHIMLNATPEFHFTLSRSKTSEWIADFDSSYKGWTEGLGLQAGLMIFF